MTPLGRSALIAGAIHLALLARLAWTGGLVDFGTFWRAVHTGDLYAGGATFADGSVFSNLTLPHTHLMIEPLGLVPMAIAWGVWLVLMAGLLVLAVRLSGTSTWWPWLVWSVPAQTQILTGHLAILCLVPMVLAWRAVTRGRWTRAGAWLGFVLAQKILVLPLIAWLAWRRQWRAVAAALGIASLWSLAGVLVYGIDAYRAWASTVAGIDWTAMPMNLSIWGLSARHGLPPVVPALASALVIGWTWHRCRHVDTSTQWLLVLLASVAIFPLGWAYYALWALPAVPQLPRATRWAWALPFPVLAVLGGPLASIYGIGLLLALTIAPEPRMTLRRAA